MRVNRRDGNTHQHTAQRQSMRATQLRAREKQGRRTRRRTMARRPLGAWTPAVVEDV